MKVLLVGTGGVGEEITAIAKRRDPHAKWMEQIILADYRFERAKEVSGRISNPVRFPAEKVDASKKEKWLH